MKLLLMVLCVGYCLWRLASWFIGHLVGIDKVYQWEEEEPDLIIHLRIEMEGATRNKDLSGANQGGRQN